MPRGRKKGSKNKNPRKTMPPRKKIGKRIRYHRSVSIDPKKLKMGEERLAPYAHKTAWKRVRNRHKWCSVFFKRKNPLSTIKNVLAAEAAYGKKAARIGTPITKITPNYIYRRQNEAKARKMKKRFMRKVKRVNRFLKKRKNPYEREIYL